MSKKPFTINSKKFDGTIHRSWKCELIQRTDSLLIFYGVFDKEIIHSKLGIIKPGTISYEYYWLDKHFNVFSFFEPTGEFRNYYCNINTPPTIIENTLEYIDLDIDIIVWKDFKIEIIDAEEFSEHMILYDYPVNTIIRVNEAVEQLKIMIINRTFPFNIT